MEKCHSLHWPWLLWCCPSAVHTKQANINLKFWTLPDFALDFSTWIRLETLDPSLVRNTTHQATRTGSHHSLHINLNVADNLQRTAWTVTHPSVRHHKITFYDFVLLRLKGLTWPILHYSSWLFKLGLLHINFPYGNILLMHKSIFNNSQNINSPKAEFNKFLSLLREKTSTSPIVPNKSCHTWWKYNHVIQKEAWNDNFYMKNKDFGI
jgi:hypothetical protein